MPKDHKPGNQKQKNKSFKGSSKRSAKEHINKTIKKSIKKTEPLNKQNQQKIQVEHSKAETQKQEYEENIQTMIKQAKQPKIVAIVPFNPNVDMLKLKKQIQQALNIVDGQTTSYITQEIFLRVDPDKKIPFLKQPLQFIFVPRDMESILDACKVADILCPVISCTDINIEQLALDPYKNSNAYDDFGYRTISSIKVQGMLPTVCLIQGMEVIAENKKNQVKKLFTRYLQTEFGNDQTVLSLENNQTVFNCLRYLQGINEQKQEWRDIRGYMLPDEIDYDVNTNQLVISGIWRGQSGISPNQLIHITGIDDFQIDRIELVSIQRPNMKQQMVEEDLQQLVRDPNLAESLDPLCKKAEDQDITSQLLSQIEGLDLGQNDQLKQKQQMQDEEEEIEDQQSDVSFNGEDDCAQDPNEKRKQSFEITQRTEEDLEFDDEAQYNIEELLRDKYKDYQGLKNFKNSSFDPYTFLPDEIDKIYNVRALSRVKHDVLKQIVQQEHFVPGLRIKLFVLGFPQDLINKLKPNKICVISGLLKYERKMTQIHVKIHKASDLSTPIQSKALIDIQVGFRRAKVQPIYSKIYNNCDKTKYVKTINDDSVYLASFYFFCTFPPQKVLMFQSEFDFRNGVLMASGDVQKCDTFQVIMKRKILTGYPYKINKRKAVVRLMFFNPNDIRYFKPVDINTKLGLRGNIIEPLGTHGLMKCMFNNYVKPNDTICLNLYKRVHPKFPLSLKTL